MNDKLGCGSSHNFQIVFIRMEKVFEHRLRMLQKAFELELWLGWFLMTPMKKGPFKRPRGSLVLRWGIWGLTFLGSTTCASTVISQWEAQRTEQCSHGFCVTPDYRLDIKCDKDL